MNIKVENMAQVIQSINNQVMNKVNQANKTIHGIAKGLKEQMYELSPVATENARKAITLREDGIYKVSVVLSQQGFHNADTDYMTKFELDPSTGAEQKSS